LNRLQADEHGADDQVSGGGVRIDGHDPGGAGADLMKLLTSKFTDNDENSLIQVATYCFSWPFSAIKPNNLVQNTALFLIIFLPHILEKFSIQKQLMHLSIMDTDPGF
jgi:hypothetical protein